MDSMFIYIIIFAYKYVLKVITQTHIPNSVNFAMKVVQLVLVQHCSIANLVIILQLTLLIILIIKLSTRLLVLLHAHEANSFLLLFYMSVKHVLHNVKLVRFLPNVVLI
jgi:hypothetical protein